MKVMCIHNDIPKGEEDHWEFVPEVEVGKIYEVIDFGMLGNFLVYLLEGFSSTDSYDARAFRKVPEPLNANGQNKGKEIPVFVD